MFMSSAVILSYSCLIICSLFTILNCVVDTCKTLLVIPYFRDSQDGTTEILGVTLHVF